MYGILLLVVDGFHLSQITVTRFFYFSRACDERISSCWTRVSPMLLSWSSNLFTSTMMITSYWELLVVVVVSTPSRAWARTGSQTPARGPPSFSPHTSSSAATPTGSVHKSQTVSVVGMSGQLKRCNESWFRSLQSGQFAAGWLAGSILCR